MRTLFKSTSQIVLLVFVDIVCFFSLYAIFSVALRDFALIDALTQAGYEVVWRMISLQIPIQIGFLLFINLLDRQRNYFEVLLATMLAFSFACLFSFSDVNSIWKLLSLPTRHNLGEGFAIFVSVTLAYVIMKLLSRGTEA